MSRPRSTSGSYSADRRRRADKSRRRVRSRGRAVGTSAQGGGRSGAPSRLVPTPRKSMKRVGRKVRRQLGGRKTAGWGAISLICLSVAIVTYTLGWSIATLVSLGVTGIVNRVEVRREGDTAPPPPRKIAKTPPTGGGSSRGGAPARPTAKPKPGGGRKAVCNARCRASTKPKTPSNCSCKADPCFHGSEASAFKGGA